MSPIEDAAPEDLAILSALCDDTATQDDVDRFQQSIGQKKEAVAFVWNYLQLHSDLYFEFTSRQATATVLRDIAEEGAVSLPCSTSICPVSEISPEPVESGSSPCTGLVNEPRTVCVAASVFPSAPIHYTLGYFTSGWPMAYLIATVVFGVGLLIGAYTHVSRHDELAGGRLPPASDRQVELQPKTEIVGSIAGMVGCTLTDVDAASTALSLGQTIRLASGLMEIAYNSGAKVILQGPVTYQVESTNSGFVARGKLTGKVEVEKAKGFAVRTPTAVVTDMGTEFGVEVDETGSTTSHVFRGAVNVRPIDRDKQAEGGGVVLRENESARTERASGDSRQVVLRRVVAKPDDFTRRLQDSSPVNVLAWFRMGEDEPHARAGAPVGAEIHSHPRRSVRLERHGSPAYSADTEAPGSSLSATFHGGSDGECFRSSHFSLIPNDYFILEVWAKPHKRASGMQTLVASGRGAENGYGLIVIDGRWHFVFEAISICDSGVACEIGKWTHLALVCERGRTQLWVNGRPVGRSLDVIPNMPDGPLTVGGDVDYPERVFDGEIDEVRLSTFIGPFRPEMLRLRKADGSL